MDIKNLLLRINNQLTRLRPSKNIYNLCKKLENENQQDTENQKKLREEIIEVYTYLKDNYPNCIDLELVIRLKKLKILDDCNIPRKTIKDFNKSNEKFAKKLHRQNEKFEISNYLETIFKLEYKNTINELKKMSEDLTQLTENLTKEISNKGENSENMIHCGDRELEQKILQLESSEEELDNNNESLNQVKSKIEELKKLIEEADQTNKNINDLMTLLFIKAAIYETINSVANNYYSNNKDQLTNINECKEIFEPLKKQGLELIELVDKVSNSDQDERTEALNELERELNIFLEHHLIEQNQIYKDTITDYMENLKS
jgi:hypothetical protein